MFQTFIWTFSTNFWHIKTDLSCNTVWPLAPNYEWDFFCDFHTLYTFLKGFCFITKALSGYFRRPTRMLLLQLRRRHWIQSLHSRWSHWNRKSQQKMERIFQWGNYCWRLWHFWHQFPKGFGRDKKVPFVRCHLPHWLQLFWTE